MAGIGLGMVIAPAINTGTFGVAPQDAGVASATVICAAAIMVDGCTGVRLPSIWRTQSQPLPRCPSVASMVDE